jgi:hypothetical protein
MDRRNAPGGRKVPRDGPMNLNTATSRRLAPPDVTGSPRAGRARVSEAIGVGFFIAIFFALQLAFPDQPDPYHFRGGLGRDQLVAVRITEMVRQNTFWRSFIEGELPSQRDSYHSLLAAYLFVPFQAFIGSNWWLYKYWHLLFAVPTMLFVYFLARRLFGQAVATGALLLLVVSPSFVSGMRIGGLLYSHMIFFSAGALCFFVSGWFAKRRSYFWFGLFFVGAGLSTHLWFYWFVVGLAALTAIYAGEIRARLKGLRPRDAVRWGGVGLLSFAAGAGVLIYREMAYPGAAVRRIFGYLTDPGNQTSPFYYFQRLPVMFAYVNKNLSSAIFGADELTWVFHWDHQNDLFPVVLWLSCLFLIVRFFRCGEKRLLVFPVFLLVMTLLIPISTGTWRVDPCYVFFFYPFPQLALAAASWEAWRLVRERLVLRRLAVAAAVVFVGLETANLAAYLNRVRLRGWEGESAAHGEMIRWLERNGPVGKTVVRFGSEIPSGEIYRWRFSHRFPEVPVRFVAGGDVTYSLHEKDVFRRDALTLVEAPAARKESGPLAAWRRALIEDEPLRRFFNREGRLAFAAYDASPPDTSPAALAVIPDWEEGPALRPAGSKSDENNRLTPRWSVFLH